MYLLLQPSGVVSAEGITVCWVEEAQTISRDSVDVLVPIIRAPHSIIIYTMNPRFPDDPIYEDFIQRADARVLQMNWNDNPWFTGSPLVAEMEDCKNNSYDVYLHIWEGEILVDGDALVFGKNVRCEWCEPPDGAQFMFGADFGFAQDPTTLNRTWMSDDESTIFIDYEAHGIRTEIDDLPELFDEIPACREWPIIADSARPETIGYLSRKGFHIAGAEKGKGSVEDGITFLQGKQIVIHPRCKNTLAEFKTHNTNLQRR